MVRESGISATKPIFPTYLLPSLRFPFRRRSSATSTSYSTSPTSAISTPTTTPGNSPPTHSHLADKKTPQRLSRTGPDTLRCMNCSSDLGFSSQIISKGFTGRFGRAFLVSPPTLPSASSQPNDASLLNIRIGRNESRQLVTGWHVVADISCSTCSSRLGWKYVDAKEPSQKYKVGKYILETERVMTYRSWEDVDITTSEVGGEEKERLKVGDDEEVVFDSEDEDECDDIFAGTWDAETVARRRSLVSESSIDR